MLALMPEQVPPVQVLVLLRTPPPQVAEQGVLVQEDQVPVNKRILKT